MNLSSDRIQVPVALRRHGGRSWRRGFNQFAKMPRWVKISVKESKKKIPCRHYFATFQMSVRTNREYGLSNPNFPKMWRND